MVNEPMDTENLQQQASNLSVDAIPESADSAVLATDVEMKEASPPAISPPANPSPELKAPESDIVYPIAVLIDELKHEDLSIRLNAIKSLKTIALALGDQRTRDELIPFLDESIDDEDEVLLVLAKELGMLVPFVGGDEYSHFLLRPLENLASLEELFVRDEAVASINEISQNMTQAQVEEFLIPCIARLSEGDWFASRSSATKLYPKAYAKALPETKQQLLVGFDKLCKDETPMVRRTAATALAEFIKIMLPDDIVEHGLKFFLILFNEDQDSVRLLVIDSLITLADSFNAEQNIKYLADPLLQLCNDKSWRVRFMVGEKLVSVANVIKDSNIQIQLGDVAINLLQDQEAEVRGVVCTQLPGLADILPLDILIDKVLPQLQLLSDDPMQYVRAKVAKNITGLCKKFGSEGTIQHLLPIFLRILKDSFPEVRLNIISQLDEINQVIGVDQLSQSLLPAIFELAEDKQWRIRLAIIEHVPLLASQLGVQFYDEKLSNLSMSWLGDPVYSIRQAATVNLKSLIEIFGDEWACKSVIPKIMAMASHPNYLYRITTVFAITTLAPSISPDVIRDLVLPTIETLMSDPIPNIRFNVAKSIESLAPVLNSSESTAPLIKSKIVPILEKLSEDQDRDVRNFADHAFDIISAMTKQFIAASQNTSIFHQFYPNVPSASSSELSSTRIRKDQTVLCVKTMLATAKFLNAIEVPRYLILNTSYGGSNKKIGCSWTQFSGNINAAIDYVALKIDDEYVLYQHDSRAKATYFMFYNEERAEKCMNTPIYYNGIAVELYQTVPLEEGPHIITIPGTNSINIRFVVEAVNNTFIKNGIIYDFSAYKNKSSGKFHTFGMKFLFKKTIDSFEIPAFLEIENFFLALTYRGCKPVFLQLARIL
ncbi:hypothetical protein BB561_001839 [Smittium simulii]|uniref:Protein phosphatase PP2A regulatory subunit A n=1 Tax=Smittium simulii TaxID=133385 RepID=A0A2T9YSU3_9FUNG|nr:hypothetical protein BB561_001839 [Smittium simulii]